jgi:hypothetical protein
VDILEPAIARNHGVKDIEAKIFATEHPVIALFHALARTVKRTDQRYAETTHGFSLEDDGRIVLRATNAFWWAICSSGELTNIYLLDRRQFHRKSPMQWWTKRKVEPLAVVFASGADLEALAKPPVILKQP